MQEHHASAKKNVEDLHVGFLVPIEVEACGEDEDGCISFFWR